MFIGYLKMVVHIPSSLSLKDKRRIINRVKNRARNSFNISVSEKPSDKWQISELSFVCINYARRYVEESMDKLENFIRLFREIQIVEIEREIL